MPVEDVHLVHRQQVEPALDLIDRLEMPRRIEHQSPPGKARRVTDRNAGQRAVRRLQLPQGLTRVEFPRVRRGADHRARRGHLQHVAFPRHALHPLRTDRTAPGQHHLPPLDLRRLRNQRRPWSCRRRRGHDAGHDLEEREYSPDSPGPRFGRSESNIGNRHEAAIRGLDRPAYPAAATGLSRRIKPGLTPGGDASWRAGRNRRAGRWKVSHARVSLPCRMGAFRGEEGRHHGRVTLSRAKRAPFAARERGMETVTWRKPPARTVVSSVTTPSVTP